MESKTVPTVGYTPWLASLLFCLTFNPLITVRADDKPIVKSIDVQYVGSKTLSKQRILAKLSTKVGKPFSVVQVDEDIKNLHASGEIANVRFLSDDVPGGMALIVVVECRSLYGGVTFEGNSLFSDRRLNKEVDHSPNQYINELSLRKARQQILSLYHKRGYGEATVDYEIGPPNQRGASRVIYQIDERGPGLLRKVRFQGNRSITSTELKEVMTQKERCLQNLVGRGGRTDADSIAGDVRSIESHYRGNGFFKARVVKVSKVPVDSKFNDLVITIDEGGQPHTVSGITIDGATSLPVDKELLPLLKTASGKPFSADDLQADIKMIEDYYRSRGYINAQVVPRLESPDGDE